MQLITKIFNIPPKIQHFKLCFPLYSKNIEECVRIVHQLYRKKPQAIFLSLNGHSENPEDCQILHDSFYNAYHKYRIPVYTFLQDRCTALSYFVGTSGYKIAANPYCLMGDIAIPTKSYTNVQKLLNFLGIKLERLGTKDSTLWNQHVEPTSHEKQFTKRWLDLISQNLIKSVSEKRSIPRQKVEEIGKKLMTPKQALENKLIDEITTAEQFKAKSFPNHKIILQEFIRTTKDPELSKREIQVLLQIKQRIQLPNVGLMTVEDPINQCIKDFLQILSVRIQDPLKLEQFDRFLGIMMEEAFVQIRSQEMMM